MMSSVIEAALKVDSAHTLTAFLGVLLLIAVGWTIRSHDKGAAPGKRHTVLMTLALKLLFGLAALATLTLAGAGTGNFAFLNFSGQVGNVMHIEAR